jgi:hypothetical protein
VARTSFHGGERFCMTLSSAAGGPRMCCSHECHSGGTCDALKSCYAPSRSAASTPGGGPCAPERNQPSGDDLSIRPVSTQGGVEKPTCAPGISSSGFKFSKYLFPNLAAP